MGGGGGGGVRCHQAAARYEHESPHGFFTLHIVTISSTELYSLMKIFLMVFKIEGSVGNRTGKSQSIIGRAKPIDYRLYNRISVSYVKQHTIGPLKTTKNLNMYPVGLKQTARHVRS